MSTSVLILAGQREGVVDPLCAEADVDKKAIIPLNGRPMLDYVLDALEAFGLTLPFYVSGFGAAYDRRLAQAPEKAGPADSALAALEHIQKFPVLLTTADHALLNSQMLTHFISGAKSSGADFCVGLAQKECIQPAYPHVKRTYIKFSDMSVSGCNLFYIANQTGLEAIRFWSDAQHFRKHPMRLARRLGFSVFWRYATGRLSCIGAFDYVSKQLKINVKPVFIPIAEAAIDVDKPSDRILVETILKARET